MTGATYAYTEPRSRVERLLCSNIPNCAIIHMHVQPRKRCRLTLPSVLERLEFMHCLQSVAVEVRLVSYYPLEVFIVRTIGVAPGPGDLEQVTGTAPLQVVYSISRSCAPTISKTINPRGSNWTNPNPHRHQR